MARLELVGDALAVVHQRNHAEVDVPGRVGTAARDANLLDDFVCRERAGGSADAAGEHARPYVAAVPVVRQPVVEQRAIRLRRLADGPVQLRRKIIEPAVFEPQLGVRIQAVVLAKADNAWRSPLRFADAEGTDAKAHPAFFSVDALVQSLDQLVDILAPPVGTRQLAAAAHIALPRRLVWEIEVTLAAGGAVERTFRALFDRVGIKIIVNVDGVDVVTLDDVKDHGKRLLGCGFFGRIHPQKAPVLLDRVGAGFRDVVWRHRRLGRGMARPIGIEPGVQFQATRVRLGDPELERVVPGLRRLALRAAQVFAPRFDFRGIYGVGAGAHLQHDGVQVQGAGALEDDDGFGLLLQGWQVRFAGPVNIGDGRHPGGAQFARRGGGIQDWRGRSRTGSGRNRRLARCGRWRLGRDEWRGCGTATHQAAERYRARHACQRKCAFLQIRLQIRSLIIVVADRHAR